MLRQMKIDFRQFLLLLFVALISLPLHAQKDKLARQYFQNGEYEKASSLYEDLYEASPATTQYLEYMIAAELELENYTKIEQVLDKMIKREPTNGQFWILKGELEQHRGNTAASEENYRRAIKNLPPDIRSISQLGNSLFAKRKYDLAMEVYDRGGKITGDSLRFSSTLAAYAEVSNNIPKLMHYSMNALARTEKQIASVKNRLQKKLKAEHLPTLRKYIYDYKTRFPDNIGFTELLEWSYVQEKDYKNAFRQARSLDRAKNENGRRIYLLAQNAENEDMYDIAVEAYQYILSDREKNAEFVPVAEIGLLNNQERLLKEQSNPAVAKDALEQQYYQYIEGYPIEKNRALLMLELADYQNRSLRDTKKSIATLEALIAIPGINPSLAAKAKLRLADQYLLDSRRWDASLLYSQIDKDFPEGELGEIARYKNAMLSYYVGEFEWAQEQFKILMASTSKLIANDAIDRSVFIVDNLGLDTTEIPMQMYAEAEFYIFQRRYEKAFEIFDQISTRYPGHGLADDILYAKAGVYRTEGEFDKAIQLYQKIETEFPDEIRADNALYARAEILDYDLHRSEEAFPLYEKIFIEFNSSTFAIEARKRYRELEKENKLP